MSSGLFEVGGYRIVVCVNVMPYGVHSTAFT